MRQHSAFLSAALVMASLPTFASVSVSDVPRTSEKRRPPRRGGYQFEPVNIDPLDKPKSKRAARRARGKRAH